MSLYPDSEYDPEDDARRAADEYYEAHLRDCNRITQERLVRVKSGAAAREQIVRKVRQDRYMRALYALRGADLNNWEYLRHAAYYVKKYAPVTQEENQVLPWPLNFDEQRLLDWID